MKKIITTLLFIILTLCYLQTTNWTKTKEEEKISKIISQIKEKIVFLANQVEGNFGTITPENGVYYYNERKETYYSSNVLYHYNTPNWIIDTNGFYRDSKGHYVVAASDMPQGTIFACSMGNCIVEDSGCAPGTTDYCVNW